MSSSYGKWLAVGKNSCRVVTYNVKNTNLNDIEVLPGEEHIIPVNIRLISVNIRLILLLSPIDLLHEESTNFKISFVRN